MRRAGDPEGRRRAVAAYDELTAAVTEILLRHDPVIGGGAEGLPDDEYEPEARTIVLRLAGARSVDDVAGIVAEELEKWFGPFPQPASTRSLRPIADEVWAAWNRIGPLS
jgi:hypothetical protein